MPLRFSSVRVKGVWVQGGLGFKPGSKKAVGPDASAGLPCKSPWPEPTSQKPHPLLSTRGPGGRKSPVLKA